MKMKNKLISLLVIFLVGCSTTYDPNNPPRKRHGLCEDVEPNVRIGEVIIKDNGYCEIVDSHDVDRAIRFRLHRYDAYHRLYFYGMDWPGHDYKRYKRHHHHKAKPKIKRHNPKPKAVHSPKKPTPRHKKFQEK